MQRAGNPHPEPPRIWQYTTDSPEVSAFITNPESLSSLTANQLKNMIDVINRGYPHFKIPKQGNKPELVERIVAANMLIIALDPTTAPSARPSATTPIPATAESTQPQAPAPAARKRPKPGEKAVYLGLIDQYNASQVASHNVSSRVPVSKLSKTGSVEILRERLLKVGVAIPPEI